MLSNDTCSVEVYKCLTANVIVETLPTVLLQLNLFDMDIFPDHLAPLLSSKQAVSQCTIYCNGLPLLGDLVSSLK